MSLAPTASANNFVFSRLLLWDCDDRSYSYYVEVSVNQRDWEVVCDRSRENCKSWQTIRFPRRPVVYIKIVGTHNTANEVFHCVHFECPAVTGEAAATGPEDSTTATKEEQPQTQHNPASFKVQRSPSRESAASHSLSSSSSSSGKSSGFVPSVANATVANLDAVVAAMAAGVVDANVDDRASHQSSPASYAGSGSIPVGASATSMARRGQWPGMEGRVQCDNLGLSQSETFLHDNITAKSKLRKLLILLAANIHNSLEPKSFECRSCGS